MAQADVPKATATKTSDAVPSNKEADLQTSESGGLFAGLKQTLRDVNQQSYAQALAMNEALEDKGILPKLKQVSAFPIPVAWRGVIWWNTDRDF